MKNYIKFLCCPECKSLLRKQKNNLICINCNREYTIKNGILILLDSDSLSKHALNQIKYFSNRSSLVHSNYKLDEWQKSYIHRFVNNFRDVKNKLIVDCGSGSGYMTIAMAKLNAKVISCDINFTSLIKLKNIIDHLDLSNRVLFICCSAEKMPLKKKVADYFISNAVLEHIENEKKAIKEVNDICKKKAGLMITVPINYRYLNPLLIPLNILYDKIIGHLRRYNKKILINKFVDWKLIKVYYTGYFIKVIMTLINKVMLIFNWSTIELLDQKNTSKSYGASNITCFFMRKLDK